MLNLYHINAIYNLLISGYSAILFFSELLMKHELFEFFISSFGIG